MMASAFKPERIRLGTMTVNFSARRAIGDRLGIPVASRAQVERFVTENGLGALDELFGGWHDAHPDADHPTADYRQQQVEA